MLSHPVLIFVLSLEVLVVRLRVDVKLVAVGPVGAHAPLIVEAKDLRFFRNVLEKQIHSIKFFLDL